MIKFHKYLVNNFLFLVTLNCFASDPLCLTADNINHFSKISFEYHGADDNDYCEGQIYANCQYKQIYLNNFVLPSWKLDDSENIKYELYLAEQACSVKNQNFINLQLVSSDGCVNKTDVNFSN